MKLRYKIIMIAFLRDNVTQVHKLVTSLTTAQQALEEIQQLKNENDRLKLENDCQGEREREFVCTEREL